MPAPVLQTREMRVEQVWPEHVDHRITYSEYGRTDYDIKTVWRISGGQCVDWTTGEYDRRPIDADITETEIWCATCGVVLPYPEG